MADSRYDVAVIGGGIVGLGAAWQILNRWPDWRVIVLEKERRVGLHQSTHNSGVLHAGIYYRPGSLKARLCTQGRLMIEDFAGRHAVPIERTGKVVVAVSPSEFPQLKAIAERAKANGASHVQVINRAELKEREPAVAGLGAIWSPATAVVDFGLVCDALSSEITALGGDVRTGAEVVAIREAPGGVFVTTLGGDLQARVIVACAGLQADRVATMAGACLDVQIVPFRGSWDVLRPRAAARIRGSVYPVPDPRFPFLGVHFTRRLDRTVWAGPNAVLAGSREGYERGTLRVRDAARALTFPGAWRMASRNLGTGGSELFHDQVRRARLRRMQRYVPELVLADLMPGPSGIRAQAVRRDGSLVDDFLITGTRRAIHLLNAPSPAATASLAIGKVLVEEVASRV